MSPTRMLMSASAVCMAAIGIFATFAPDVLLRGLGATEITLLLAVVQVTGALYLGFAALNWMGRNNLIGGIYSRPVAVANLMHFLTAGIALLKLVFTEPVPWYVMAAAITYGIFATAFALVLRRHPIRSAASGTEQPESSRISGR